MKGIVEHPLTVRPTSTADASVEDNGSHTVSGPQAADAERTSGRRVST